jgi:hypothetical protein
MIPAVNARESAAIAQRFDALAAEWKAATALLSSTTAMVAHPTYQAIIDLGPPVVPFLLKDLQLEPVHWFEALEAITGDNPVTTAHRGNIPAMAADWLAWGRNHRLI